MDKEINEKEINTIIVFSELLKPLELLKLLKKIIIYIYIYIYYYITI